MKCKVTVIESVVPEILYIVTGAIIGVCLLLHTVTPEMNLVPSVGSDKAWVYTVNADFADEEAKVEQLAIRFKNADSKRVINGVCLQAMIWWVFLWVFFCRCTEVQIRV